MSQLKYCSILIQVNKEHRLSIVSQPGVLEPKGVNQKFQGIQIIAKGYVNYNTGVGGLGKLKHGGM